MDFKNNFPPRQPSGPNFHGGIPDLGQLAAQRQAMEQLEALKFGKEPLRCECGGAIFFPPQVQQIWVEKNPAPGKPAEALNMAGPNNTGIFFCIQCGRRMDLSKRGGNGDGAKTNAADKPEEKK